MVLKVELQFHGGAVSQNPGDASVIFIAQDHGGYNLGNVIRAVLEGAYASIAHVRVIGPQHCAVLQQKLIDLLVDLRAREYTGFRLSRPLTLTTATLPGIGVLWVI